MWCGNHNLGVDAVNCDPVNCPKYSAGHKRKSHHIRLTTPCIFSNNGCAISEEVREAYILLEVQQGEACNLAKIKRIKEGF